MSRYSQSLQAPKDRTFKPGKEKVVCPVCQKPIKLSGIEDHFRVVHPGESPTPPSEN